MSEFDDECHVKPLGRPTSMLPTPSFACYSVSVSGTVLKPQGWLGDEQQSCAQNENAQRTAVASPNHHILKSMSADKETLIREESQYHILAALVKLKKVNQTESINSTAPSRPIVTLTSPNILVAKPASQ